MGEKEKNKVGRPLKFKTPQEIDVIAKEFFKNCDENDEPYTITGLALALDTTRDTLIDYQNRDEFSDTIKRLKLIVENDYEKALRKHGRAGDIFGLKNFGWKDKTEVDNNHNFNEIGKIKVDGKDFKINIG